MKSKMAFSQKGPLLGAVILCLVAVFAGHGQVMAGLNLEVPIEMVAHGSEAAVGSGTNNQIRTAILLDANDYDGATYYFEIVAKNIDSSAKSVYLRRTTSGATNHATITVPAGTSVFTRYRVACSLAPIAGKNRYLVRHTKTTAADQLVVTAARVIVKQTNATKTRIQIPLVQKNHDLFATGSGRADTTTSSAYTQGDAVKYSLWIKDSSQFADLSGATPWTLEAVLDNDSPTATTYAALFNHDTGQQVAGAEISLYGDVIEVVDGSFSNAAANFTDGSKFELKIRSSSSGIKAHLGRASLYVSLTNLSKAEVLYRVSRKNTGTPAEDLVEQRTLLDTSLFTNPKVYFEASGYCLDNGERLFLRDHGANVSGTGGSDVTGSGINFNTGTRTVVRTAEINPTSGNNYYVRDAASTNTVISTHAWIVVQSPAASCPTPGTPSNPSPTDGASNVSVDADLSWDPCSDTDSYEVYFGENSNPPYLGDTTDTSYPLPTHEYCTQYYWKIVAKNDEGCSTTGDIWYFTTEDGPPGTPGSPDPADLETGVSANAVLDWSDCTSTDTYDLYLGTSDPPGLYASDLTDSTHDPNLDWDTHYYWKVEAKSGCGSSTASDVWEFTTGLQPAADHFVSSAGSNDEPYEGWATAAHQIQTAINYASAGETVMVRAGETFAQAVIMKDGVNLVAEEGVRPIIVANPQPVMSGGTVRFDGPMIANLTGFAVQATNIGSAIFLDGSSGTVNATIDNCTANVSAMGVGIRLDEDVSATITGCHVFHAEGAGGPRVGIGGSGFTGMYDRLASGSSVTIMDTTVGGSSGEAVGTGIRLFGDAGASNIQLTIGGSGVDDGNTISYCYYTGMLLWNIDQLSIQNNDVSNSGHGGIVLVDSNTVSPHIKNNTIHHQTTAAGINIGGASNVTISDDNDVYANNTGIAFYVLNNGEVIGGSMDPVTKSVSSQPVTITGNNIYSNTYGGIAIRDGITGAVTITQNDIYSNRAAIRMQRRCNLTVSRNDIHDNIRGGIHTGDYRDNGEGFIAGQIGEAVLTIEKNKIYGNGGAGYGAGIDIRHASGTIYNNLIYGNHSGVRYGDYVSEIVNNTVADNGENDNGGGIVYDDLTGAVNAEPGGSLDDSPNFPPNPLIRNNIIAYNEKAGIRVGGNGYDCPENPDLDSPNVGDKYRDYNLLYSNFGWDSDPDCGWPENPGKKCANQQYGGCGAHFDFGQSPPVVLENPNDIMADPQFTDKDNDDYTLQSGSPAEDAGDDGTDMGAYGGTDPIDW